MESFEEVKKHLLETASEQHVFVKEISFFLCDFLAANEEFVANPNINFVFLIRNPHNAILSYYKKYQYIVPDFSFFVGCESSWKDFEIIKAKAKNPITIISAEELCGEPFKTAQHLFARLSLPFRPECLSWEDLGDNFTGDSWSDAKVQEKIYHWHDSAIKSTGFSPLANSQLVDQNGAPTFEEIENEQDRQECKKMYDENFPFYQKLLNEKTP